jgi:ApbE superfamily uncharacterized protein (UPF0280 family)
MPLRHHFELHETIATVIADSTKEIDAAGEGMANARHDIERYILADPFFKTSFEPIPVCSDLTVINRMAEAGYKAHVGPMAAVAGAIACAGIENVLSQDSHFCIIDNGGDIAFISDREIRIGLYAGNSPHSGRYAFLMRPRKEIYGVCTSSATVGHSISLGIADSVTVFGPDPVLADAVATEVCNQISPGDQSVLLDLPEGIEGIFALIGDKSIIWGDIPRIVPARIQESLITAGGI